MLVSFIIAVILSASRDKIRDHWNNSIFRYWVQGTSWERFFNTTKSWLNKYKLDEEGNRIRDPERPGKFLRKTIVIFGWDTGIWLPAVFTDAWHMIKGGEILLYSLSIGIAIAELSTISWMQYWYYNTIVLVLFWSVVFELFYADWLDKKIQNIETAIFAKMVKGDIKLYLDDKRDVPDETWTLARSVEVAMRFLKTNKVAELSLDHDLGNDTPYTGYDLLQRLENEMALGKLNVRIPEKIKVHSANVPARKRMKQAIESIENMRREN